MLEKEILIQPTMGYDFAYEDLLEEVLKRGAEKGDRTGTGTRSKFGTRMEWWLPAGFPLITTKKVWFKGVVEELLWMLSGSTNNNDLVARGVHIWDEWAKPDGDLGPIYGQQWRSWAGQQGPIDQISWVINEIRNNPDSRRLVVSAWNVDDLPRMALSPCHALFQFYVTPMTAQERTDTFMRRAGVQKPPRIAESESDRIHHLMDEAGIPRGYLSCQLYQRSADMFLGVPFNIASYALLTCLIAQQCGLKPGSFVWVGGDTHIYNNHFEQVRTQLDRSAAPYPGLALRKRDSIFDYTVDDIELIDYKPQPAIAAPVAV